jgi:hypothetical protein
MSVIGVSLTTSVSVDCSAVLFKILKAQHLFFIV